MKYLKKYCQLLLIAVLLTIISILATRSVSSAYTTEYVKVKGGNGHSVSYYNTKSNVLWIGDSRTIQMYQSHPKQSYIAVWGGHYGFGGSRMQIDHSTRLTDMKKIIKKMVKKKGKAFVVLNPTINDYSGREGGCGGALNMYLKLYRTLSKVSKKAIILSPCLIKEYGSYSCSAFNSKLKRSVKHYVNVKLAQHQYSSDRCHFSAAGLKHIYKKVQRVKRKLVAKQRTPELVPVRDSWRNLTPDNIYLLFDKLLRNLLTFTVEISRWSNYAETQIPDRPSRAKLEEQFRKHS